MVGFFLAAYKHLRGASHRAPQFVHPPSLGNNIFGRLSYFLANLHSLIGLDDGSFNLDGGFLNRLRAGLCQRTSIICHNGELGLSCTRSFNRFVESKNIRLKSDLVDAFDDFASVVAGCLDAARALVLFRRNVESQLKDPRALRLSPQLRRSVRLNLRQETGSQWTPGFPGNRSFYVRLSDHGCPQACYPAGP